jgi:phage gp36-like protein
MSNYCTQQDLIDSFGWQEVLELSNLDDPAARQINPVRIAQVIVEAGAEIDGYIGSRYKLPLLEVPVILKLCALDIVRYRLDKNQQREDVRQRYEDRLRFLELVGKGQMSLGVVDSESSVPVGGVDFTAPVRQFTLESLEGF